MHYHTQYRLRLLRDVARHFVIPFVALEALLFVYKPSTNVLVSTYWKIPVSLAFILLWAVFRLVIRSWIQGREARNLGGTRIPTVQGKWPGNIDILIKMMKAFQTSYLLDVYLDLFTEYQCTTINLRILWVDQIITMDQEHIKFLLATGFEKFWRGNLQKERMETFLGDGIFNRDDAIWKMHRSNARPFFVRDRISHVDVFEKNFNRILSILLSYESVDRPIDLQDLFGRFTMDSASEFLFGQSFNTLGGVLPSPWSAQVDAETGTTVSSSQGAHVCVKGSATDDTWGAFVQAFESCQQNITRRVRLGYIWPLFELFEDRSLKHQRTIRKWLDPLVTSALEDKKAAIQKGVKSSLEEKTFLQHLVESTDDPALIRDQLLAMLLASRDSTAILITYTCYFLALHPEVLERLRAEVFEYCGPDTPPDYDTLQKMRYLRAVINETLRIFPPVPLNIRESRAGCALPPADTTYANDHTRFYMPGGVNIVWLPMLLHRNAALWGPDADEFKPDRWLQPESVAKYVANPFMYGPFSAGPRTCLGRGYGLNEASYFLVRLLQHFDILQLDTESQPPESRPREEWKFKGGRQAKEQIWPAAAMTLFVKGGLWMKLKRSDAMLN